MTRKKKTTAPAKSGPKRPGKYTMRLYVTGATPRSSAAISNLRKLCDEHLPGRYQLRVIDIYQRPNLARQGGIIAAPTLVKSFPLPLRRFIGDMSNKEKLLVGLELGDAGSAKRTKRPRKE